MGQASIRISRRIGILACIVATATLAQAQGQKVYRYVDPEGRTVYSDHAPPPSAKNVQIKKLGQNLIETEPPLSQRIAQERYPVTFYTFDCGDLCQRGEALLNRRGVPFTTVLVNKPEGADRLKRLTGEVEAPVLQVGDKLIAKGFNESVWQDLLTEAGYPKTPPPRRITPQPKPPAEAPKAEPKAKSVAPPPSDNGYPK
jgi:glutaredoxin